VAVNDGTVALEWIRTKGIEIYNIKKNKIDIKDISA
jgi:hypothetical protein